MHASVNSVNSADRAAGGTPPVPATAAATVPAAAAMAVPAAAAAAAVAVPAAAAAAVPTAAAAVVPAAAAVAGPSHHEAMTPQEVVAARAREIDVVAAARCATRLPGDIDQTFVAVSESGASGASEFPASSDGDGLHFSSAWAPKHCSQQGSLVDSLDDVMEAMGFVRGGGCVYAGASAGDANVSFGGGGASFGGGNASIGGGGDTASFGGGSASIGAGGGASSSGGVDDDGSWMAVSAAVTSEPSSDQSCVALSVTASSIPPPQSAAGSDIPSTVWEFGMRDAPPPPPTPIVAPTVTYTPMRADDP